jgi:hypothetical protein
MVQETDYVSSRFLREDDEGTDTSTTWDDQLAKKYYDSLARPIHLSHLSTRLTQLPLMLLLYSGRSLPSAT